MADETVEQPLVAEQQPVEIKPEAIVPKDEKIDETASDLPYHTKETEGIAADRAKDAPTVEEDYGPYDEKYEFKANGYTVKQVKPSATTPTAFEVTADGFSKGFASKREAEIFAETHAPVYKN